MFYFAGFTYIFKLCGWVHFQTAGLHGIAAYAGDVLQHSACNIQCAAFFGLADHVNHILGFDIGDGPLGN